MKLEERKLKEIEHSQRRRSILQGFERHSDTHKSEKANNLDSMIRDQKAFNYHFSNIKYYSITHSSEKYQYDWLKERCKPGVRVLDFGCGNGENGIYAAQCGVEVIGIDISPEGVANANLNAKQAGVDGHCKFEVMDGESMTFADNTFDLGIEYGVLHHVDLDKAMIELNRVLKPDGEMICVEALRHNPIIHWYRKKTPHLRTQWEFEHILGVEDLAIARKYFHEINVKFFHLAVLAAVPLRKMPFFKPLRALLNKADSILLRSERIGKYGWIMIFTMGKPKK
ncbi:MAG: class I SAM-dependent methyltransferase [Deltaproteobacteria bacterium]|jgi:SAM-dependent methyltransferase|nr:class I SAM-dependent methyltransferase [Deltaproteobacteria bacterium]